MSTPVSTPNGPQPAPASVAAAAIPRSAQRDTGNSKLGTFGVRTDPSNSSRYPKLIIPRSNQAWPKCSKYSYSKPSFTLSYLFILLGRCHHGCHQPRASADHHILPLTFHSTCLLPGTHCRRGRGMCCHGTRTRSCRHSPRRGCFTHGTPFFPFHQRLTDPM